MPKGHERLGAAPVVLHEQPNRGRTIIEKLEAYSQVSYAVVLLTPDDIGRAKDDIGAERDRARQNVVFELGMFIGKLGRSQVCALHKGSLELPSDVDGVLYVPMDSGGAWRLTLAKELRDAGFEVDMSKL